MEDVAVAVRSSATAEDLPDASFAGQQESFLNIRGADAVIDAVRRVFASLFTDRAVSYRCYHGYDKPILRCRSPCNAWCIVIWPPVA